MLSNKCSSKEIHCVSGSLIIHTTIFEQTSEKGFSLLFLSLLSVAVMRTLNLNLGVLFCQMNLYIIVSNLFHRNYGVKAGSYWKGKIDLCGFYPVLHIPTSPGVKVEAWAIYLFTFTLFQHFIKQTSCHSHWVNTFLCTGNPPTNIYEIKNINILRVFIHLELSFCHFQSWI